MGSRRYITFELLVVFVLIPAIIAWLGAKLRFLIIPTLVIGAGYCLYALSKCKRQEAVPSRLKGRWAGVLLRFVVGGAVLTALVYLLDRPMFLHLPRHNVKIWLLIMICYPLLSVAPQELIYRKFFFRRLESMNVRSPVMVIVLSSVAFSFAHLIFGNWQAVVLTLVGGVFFSFTYHRTRSLLAVCVEHALWGNLIFTIGMGRYFFYGSRAMAGAG